ncbi:MAG: tRNA (N6-threonylcarbamoyladenosine(37)-N6)-methyltransferase TrmO [Sedimentisphaerales bacterium]|nr:tRNA (N6-threonylcarbamoyladenosine(37)-N6)-methyltransferase TrmO [Sedimentisphaerales bacterium]
MNPIKYKPIGIIHSPFPEPKGIPRQAIGAPEITAKIEIFDEYLEGLTDLEGFSHIVVIFHLHLVNKSSLMASPPWDNREHGVFATRSPHRPNPIGISVVRLENIDRNILNISGVDMVDGTPVLDVKPYIPTLNPTEGIRTGWLQGKTEGMNKSKSGDR